MKCSEIIFDSNKDYYSKNKSTFDSKIIHKSNLVFIIEDENENKFGGYVNAEIGFTDNQWTTDPRAFLFSLKSNGRLYQPMKFNVSKPSNAFRLYPKSSNRLFKFGEDEVRIEKKGKKESYCHSYKYYSHYDYNGIENALRGTSGYFIPKRIVVIQMN